MCGVWRLESEESSRQYRPAPPPGVKPAYRVPYEHLRSSPPRERTNSDNNGTPIASAHITRIKYTAPNQCQPKLTPRSLRRRVVRAAQLTQLLHHHHQTQPETSAHHPPLLNHRSASRQPTSATAEIIPSRVVAVAYLPSTCHLCRAHARPLERVCGASSKGRPQYAHTHRERMYAAVALRSTLAPPSI